MRKKIGWLALIVAAFGLGQASAQPAIPDGVFVRDSADNTWLVTNGTRAVVPIHPATDEQIAALPESGRWVASAADGAITLGDRPAWAEAPAPIRRGDDSPTLTFQLAAAEIDRGATLELAIRATDDVGLDWIEWEVEVGDEDEATEDPELAREHRFECGGQTECSNTWLVPTTGVGRYSLVVRARDTTGQRTEATTDLVIR
jgi:hypothetical protein